MIPGERVHLVGFETSLTVVSVRQTRDATGVRIDMLAVPEASRPEGGEGLALDIGTEFTSGERTFSVISIQGRQWIDASIPAGTFRMEVSIVADDVLGMQKRRDMERERQGVIALTAKMLREQEGSGE